MRKESKEFLRAYLNANAPTGFETAGQQVWLDYLKPYIDEYEVDVYGSVVGVINPDVAFDNNAQSYRQPM